MCLQFWKNSFQNYAPHVKFYYTTITLGIDPGYSSQVFYNRILDNDTQRVIDRFRNADSDQVTVLVQFFVYALASADLFKKIKD